jgi:hypothetical protein
LFDRQNALLARWHAMDRTARGAVLVSVGSFTLVVMALLVKLLGPRIPTMEILFFRSLIGFLFVLPLFIRNPLEPLHTKRQGMHLVRGAIAPPETSASSGPSLTCCWPTPWPCNSRGRCS